MNWFRRICDFLAPPSPEARRERELISAQDQMIMGDLSTGEQKPVSQTNGGKLYRLIAKGRCPDCGNKGFWDGPEGGMSQNIFCQNARCRSGFNVTQVLGIADRIGKGGDHYYPAVTGIFPAPDPAEVIPGPVPVGDISNAWDTPIKRRAK